MTHPAPTDQLPAAIARMADVLTDSDIADEVGHYLNCGEAEALAAVLVEAGRRDDAAVWLAWHAQTDENDWDPFDGQEGSDEGDLHGHLYPRDPENRNEYGALVPDMAKARGYVDQRWPADLDGPAAEPTQDDAAQARALLADLAELTARMDQDEARGRTPSPDDDEARADLDRGLAQLVPGLLARLDAATS